MKTKDEIRQEIMEQRKSLTKKEVMAKSKAVIGKLKGLVEFQQAKAILFYVSFKNEVFTHDLIKEALREKIVVVPYLVNDEIVISIIDSFEHLKPGTHNILEPQIKNPILHSHLDLVIVPGVAFDKDGNRLGFGVGYYDRFLKHVNCPKIGLAYDFQVVDSIPAEEHDVRVDMVISD